MKISRIFEGCIRVSWQSSSGPLVFAALRKDFHFHDTKIPTIYEKVSFPSGVSRSHSQRRVIGSVAALSGFLLPRASLNPKPLNNKP